MTNNIFRVGGAVRDLFLGVKPKDIDFSVEAPSFDAMRQLILDKGGKIFLETPEFVTIRAKVPNIGAADFVLCRKEGAYRDGRHPDSVEVGTILDDLARRDFTMNAIAINADDEFDVIDPHGGINDIAFKTIRCVGNATQRFNEDKLRVFRALRFCVTLQFGMAPDVVNGILDSASADFSAVSTERIREELGKMFAANSGKSFNLLFGTFPHLGNLVLERGIWFRPTVEKA